MAISKGGLGLLGLGLGFPAGDAMGGGSGGGVDLEKWGGRMSWRLRRSTNAGRGGGGDSFLPFTTPQFRFILTRTLRDPC
jgi:hypothetical protein